MFCLNEICLRYLKDTLKKITRQLQLSMVPTISVFHFTLMFINPARLFHDFQNVEWFVQRWMICNDDVECILTTLNDLYYVEWFMLRWMICTKLHILYLQLWTCFDYVERFALLFNDLEGSMKLPPGKYPLEHCLGIFSPMKIPTMFIAKWENPRCGNSSGNNYFAANEKTDCF